MSSLKSASEAINGTVEMIEGIGKAAGLARFMILRRVRGFTVSDTPHLDPEGRSFFIDHLKLSKRYLEYGSGGSTVLAARQGLPFVSVDNDRVFHESVKRAIGPLNGNQVLLTVNTGLTGPWGYPIFKGQTANRKLAWASYAHAPWQFLSMGLTFPDLVLVDGRFRVASALVSFLHLAEAKDSMVLVDDYVGRDGYEVIREFATLERIVGLLAVFRTRTIDRSALLSAIAMYETDYR